MAWRAFVSEVVGAGGALEHVLDCGHRKRALCAPTTGTPYARQWCQRCSPASLPQGSALVLVRREHVEYALAILRGAAVSQPDLRDRAVADLERALTTKSRRAPARPSGMRRQPAEYCATCGGHVFVDAMDNLGNRYRGCARCRIAP